MVSFFSLVNPFLCSFHQERWVDSTLRAPGQDLRYEPQLRKTLIARQGKRGGGTGQDGTGQRPVGCVRMLTGDDRAGGSDTMEPGRGAT